MTYTAANASAFHSIYRKGLADESLVKQHLVNTGRILTPSTKEQDMFEDTDCFIDGRAVSIKTQHSAAKYGTIGLELTQHLTIHQDCATSKTILANKELTLNDIKRLEATGSWRQSWFYNGKADDYYVYIGEVLRIYKKEDILAHLAAHPYKRIRALRADTKANQGGKYRFCNAISGYLDINAVKHTKELVSTAYDHN
jgi:hypothetical protein